MIYLKFVLFILSNILLGVVLFVLLLRPLSPSAELIKINFGDKPYAFFLIETIVFALVVSAGTSALSFLPFEKTAISILHQKAFIKLFLIHFVFALISSIEYILFISKEVYGL